MTLQVCFMPALEALQLESVRGLGKAGKGALLRAPGHTITSHVKRFLHKPWRVQWHVGCVEQVKGRIGCLKPMHPLGSRGSGGGVR